jgi:hypothetical protein
MPRATDPDITLVDRMFDLHSPKDDDVVKDLDDLRAAFKRVAKLVVKKAPRTPDRTVALRSLHRACMDSIFAVVAAQDDEEPVEPTPQESDSK